MKYIEIIEEKEKQMCIMCWSCFK